MAETVVVTHFVAELVVQRVIESHDATATRAAVYNDTGCIVANAVVGGQLGDHIGVAPFPLAGSTVDAVIGIVDPQGDQLLANTLSHGAVVPVPFARIVIGQHGSVRQHHFGEGQWRVLAHDQPAGGDGLEVFPMGSGIAGEMELVAGRGQHPDVDRMNEQFRRCPDFEIGQRATQVALSKLQVQAGHNPVRWQHTTPSVVGVPDPLVLQITFQNPLATHRFEEQGLAAGDRNGTAAVVDGRPIAGIRADAKKLPVELCPARNTNVADPLTVSGLDLHQRVLLQSPLKEGLFRLAQPLQVAPVVDDAAGYVWRSEINFFFWYAVHVVGSFRKFLWWIEVQRAKRLPPFVTSGDIDGQSAIRLQRLHQQKALTLTDQVRLVVPLARMNRHDLALGESHLRGQRSLQIAGRSGRIEDQRLRCRISREQRIPHQRGRDQSSNCSDRNTHDGSRS